MRGSGSQALREVTAGPHLVHAHVDNGSDRRLVLRPAPDVCPHFDLRPLDDRLGHVRLRLRPRGGVEHQASGQVHRPALPRRAVPILLGCRVEHQGWAGGGRVLAAASQAGRRRAPRLLHPLAAADLQLRLGTARVPHGALETCGLQR